MNRTVTFAVTQFACVDDAADVIGKARSMPAAINNWTVVT